MSPTFRPLTRTVLRTPFLQTIRPNRATAAFSTSIPRLATQDYGSGDGNPAGENPQAQGKNPSEHLEHPGPPPPDVGKGSGKLSIYSYLLGSRIPLHLAVEYNPVMQYPRHSAGKEITKHANITDQQAVQAEAKVKAT